MNCKNVLNISLIALAIVCSAASCTKETSKNLNISATVEAEGFDGILVHFKAGDGVSKVCYAYGSQMNAYSDSINFEKGLLKTTSTVDVSAEYFSVSPEAGSPVVIFIRPISSDGENGRTISVDAVAGPVPVSISLASLGSFVYTVGEDTGDFEGVSMLAMGSETPEEWGMSAEEIIDMYAMYGMLEPTPAKGDKIVELNGDPNRAHIVGVVYWNPDYTYTIKTFNYTTGPILDQAGKATVSVEAKNIASESVDLVFTPGEATCGYYYTLYTKENYDATREEGKTLGQDPDEYIRDLAAAGGSMNYKTQTDKREYLSAGTEYVLACFPYNVNGSKGWGDSCIIRFTTTK